MAQFLSKDFEITQFLEIFVYILLLLVQIFAVDILNLSSFCFIFLSGGPSFQTRCFKNKEKVREGLHPKSLIPRIRRGHDKISKCHSHSTCVFDFYITLICVTIE